MKILLLSKYDKLGASSRVRSLQYIPYLEKEGIFVFVSSLFNNNYLDILYKKGKKSLYCAFIGYIKRLYQLLFLRKYDLIWIEKEIFPMLPPFLESIFKNLNIPYIVDYDDAVFHNYDLNKNILIRAMYKKKIDIVMKKSRAVIVGNKYLANRAFNAGAKKVYILPSSVDLNKYIIKSYKPDDNIFKIGWIGTPKTFNYLNIIIDVLEQFTKKYKSKVIAIGGDKKSKLGEVPIEIREWRASSEVDDIYGIDVGIMPLIDGPWERGKCGYKLIQYMACCKPVIGSPIGVNKEIIKNGENGYKPKNKQEWFKYLEILYMSKDLRIDMGKKGRKIVEKKYSLQENLPKLIGILKESRLND